MWDSNNDGQWKKNIYCQPDPELLIPFPYIASYSKLTLGLGMKNKSTVKNRQKIQRLRIIKGNDVF